MMGWVTKTIGEVTTIINGGTPKSGVSEYWDGDVLWITPKDMGQLDSAYVSDTSRKISKKGLSKSSAKLIPENSVILSTRAPIGHLAINTLPMATNQGCRGLVPSAKLGTTYLFYFLRLNVDLLNDLGSGTTFKELSKGALTGVQIPLPPLPEQKRIVAILDEAFAGIDAAVANNKQNLANARDLFESYLNAVFTQKGDGWVESTFGEVVLRSRGGISIKSKEYSPSGTPVLTKGDVKPFGRVVHGGKFVDSKHTMSEGWPLTVTGDLIVTTRDLKPTAPFLGLVGIVPSDGNYLVNQGATFFSVDNTRVLSEYFVYWCCSIQYREHVVSKKSGSTQVHIRQDDLFSAPLCFPSIGEQKRIVELLDSLFGQTAQLATLYQEKIKSLDSLKQSILQKAFTGKLTSLPAKTIDEAVA